MEKRNRPLSFPMFLTKYSACFINDQLLWLRFLLGDILEVSDLYNDDVMAITLLHLLKAKGIINEKEVRLLYDIAEVTEIEEAKQLFRQYTQNIGLRGNGQSYRQIHKERRAIFKAIRLFTTTGTAPDMPKMAGYYGLITHKFTNPWDLIYHLELYIWPTKPKEDYLEEFYALINPMAQKKLEPIMADLRADAQANRAALEDDAAEEAGSSDTVLLRTKVPTRREKKKFGDFLVKLSKYYSGIRVLWLRCLLFDHIGIGVLARNKIDGIGMFNELWDTGEISCNDVDLLSEIAQLTKNKSAISHVTEYKTKTIKKHVPITKRKKLTQYRKNLFRALQLVEEDKLEFLANSYQQHYSDFKNIWDLVFFLEKDEQLEDKPDKVKRFGNLLNQKAKRAFLDGLVTTSRKRKDGLERGDDTPSKRKKGEQSTMSSSSNSEDADSSDDSNLG